MATNGALGTLFVFLVFAAISAALIISFTASAQQKTQAATESGTFQRVRQAYLIQTADLPDLKLEDIGVSASCTKQAGQSHIIKMHFKISNRGESDASVSVPGIGVCSDEKMQVSYYACVPPGGGRTLCCPISDANVGKYCDSRLMEFYGDPQWTDLKASELIPTTETFAAAFTDNKNTNNCPGSFKFTPYICAGGIEELNDENNYLYRGQSMQAEIKCDMITANNRIACLDALNAVCEYACRIT